MNYNTLSENLSLISENVTHTVSVLSNASSLLFNALDRINWAGFYLSENSNLFLGPFQGKPACIEIPYGKGVCGTAAITKTAQLVPDVHKFPGHIACDEASRSEIVIPIIVDEELFGVLDIDSPVVKRFSEEDLQGLQLFVNTLIKYI